jgi:hypothetical protein
MTDDRTTPWVLQYRASVSDTPTPSLDQAILAAASRQSAWRRVTRQLTGVSIIAAFAVLVIGTVWHGGLSNSHPQIVRTDFGRLEGISRRYLMEVQPQPFTGFGIAEGRP